MRLTAVEKRIMLLAGMASALGGALGTIITSLINT
jgi:hypothetical protein